LLCPVLTILKSLLFDLLVGKVVRLPVNIVNQSTFGLSLPIEQLKQYRHDMFTTRPGIRTITLAGDGTIQDNFRSIIAIITIDLIHIPTIAALFVDKAKRSVSLQ
jgi:hypothetical protein